MESIPYAIQAALRLSSHAIGVIPTDYMPNTVLRSSYRCEFILTSYIVICSITTPGAYFTNI